MLTRQSLPRAGALFLALTTFFPTCQASTLDGAQLSLWWGLPFAGILLSIALLPLFAAQFWHHHYGKVALGWALLFFIPFAIHFGVHAAAQSLAHALLAEYLPFVILLTALFTISGGIYIQGRFQGTPALNTAILFIGALLASIMGTTGASMLLIRPLLRANAERQRKAHIVVFFIFIVANIGGSLSPLGDPPLFLGFLKGIDFFWPLQHLWPETLFMVGALLLIFWALDAWFYRQEKAHLPPASASQAHAHSSAPSLSIQGAGNFLALAAVIALVLLSGLWQPSTSLSVLGTEVSLGQIVRDGGLVVLTWLSLRLTARHIHDSNGFNWLPMQEVAKLFVGIFLTIIPVIAMLQAGNQGPFSFVLHAITQTDGTPIPRMYFWATGMLSGFLDNAPTYLVFYNSTGADAATLMTSLAGTLSAISAGAVFMGALSYIGNAPNLMVKAIAEERGVRMPSFFGYIGWSFCILLPLFAVVTLIWY